MSVCRWFILGLDTQTFFFSDEFLAQLKQEVSQSAGRTICVACLPAVLTWPAVGNLSVHPASIVS